MNGLQPDGYLFDVGCGPGRLAKPLSAYLNGRYLGIDIVPELVEHARATVDRPDWRFKVADGLTIPEKVGEANQVCFFSVLTHLLHEQSFRYLEEARRVLKPTGRIIFSFLEFGAPDL
jgi:ubiquinone/menaquinone biosynthesis C-methylase UbiE